MIGPSVTGHRCLEKFRSAKLWFVHIYERHNYHDISYVPFIKRNGYSPWSLVNEILITVEFFFLQLCVDGMSEKTYQSVYDGRK